MPKEFTPVEWDEVLEDDCRQIVRLAVREDLDRSFDWTTVSLVGHEVTGRAKVMVREAGVVAGLQAARTILEEVAPAVVWQPAYEDGTRVEPNTVAAQVSGPARDLLTCERIVLNFLGRMSGIATLTSRYVAQAAGSPARIYDTRKTTPGWRRLEKYAVRCGGGHNHRTGLFDAVLIKDNHLALGKASQRGSRFTPAEAITRVREVLAEALSAAEAAAMIVEIEVDTLDQLENVLPAGPDIVLLDNMAPELLREAVETRNRINPQVELEASGGVTLDRVAAIAAAGIDRISVGALTHSAVSLDIGLDWES